MMKRVQPITIALKEYRLARLRDELNPKRTGFHAAWNRYLELAR